MKILNKQCDAMSLLALVSLLVILLLALKMRLSDIEITTPFINGITPRPPSLDDQLKTALKKAGKTKKVILGWYPDDHQERMKRYLWDSKNICPTEDCGSCTVTLDKHRITHKDTAAVIFLYKYVTPKIMPPAHVRRTDQLYIWWAGESPSNLMHHRKVDMKYFDSLQFNATMSYRRSADIYHPYENLRNLSDLRISNLTWILKSKTYLSTTVVSDCDKMPGARTRFKYFQYIISTGFKLDAWGKCFDRRPDAAKRAFDKLVEFLRGYKFYFAFENSYHCRDYITEKVFQNSFRANAVPVVWGATKEDYEAVLPPNSFIFVEDFSSIDDLLEYLNYLDKNDTAYLEYFRWRTRSLEDLPQFAQSNHLCQICRILHGINVDDVYKSSYNASSWDRPLIEDQMSDRTVPSISKLVYGNERPECLKRYIKPKLIL